MKGSHRGHGGLGPRGRSSCLDCLLPRPLETAGCPYPSCDASYILLPPAGVALPFAALLWHCRLLSCNAHSLICICRPSLAVKSSSCIDLLPSVAMIVVARPRAWHPYRVALTSRATSSTPKHDSTEDWI